MRKLKIVTDSSCTMEKSVKEKLNIHVMPLSVMIDGVIYTDEDSLAGNKFMQMMQKANELPKTSQPPIGEFVALYDELGEDGSEILSIHMTKGLSGTVEAARQAGQLSKSKVTVIDSGTTDQALSFQVIRAAQLAAADKNLAEVLPEVEKVKENTKLYMGVSTLENLVKGGRISRAKGMLSGILNMRIILDFASGELVPVVKGRGAKTFTKWFEAFKAELKHMPNVKQVGISYAGGYDQVEKFKNELQELYPEMNIPLLPTTPIIATHAGDNAFAITYYTA